MDYQQLRIDSHDRQKAKQIRESNWTILLEDTLNGNVLAAKVFCNLLFHFEEDRKRLNKAQVAKIAELVQKGGFVYARILFWITTIGSEEIIGKDTLISLIAQNQTSKEEQIDGEYELARDELIRSLINLGKIDAKQSKILVNSISEHWNRASIESLVIVDPSTILPNLPPLIKVLGEAQDSSLLLAVLRNLIKGQKNDNLRKQLRKDIFPSKAKVKGSHSFLLEVFKTRLVNGNLPPEEILAIGDFALCVLNNQPARLIYHFGYGRIAGYFYMARIDPKKIKYTGVRELSSDEEDMDKGDVDVVTGEPPRNAPPLDVMTEEEKEEESERLMRLISKLQKTGIIQIYTDQGDNDASDDR